MKKKRRRNFEDAMKTLQMIENDINDYRVKMGKKPTQRASLIITGTRFENSNTFDFGVTPLTVI